ARGGGGLGAGLRRGAGGPRDGGRGARDPDSAAQRGGGARRATRGLPRRERHPHLPVSGPAAQCGDHPAVGVSDRDPTPAGPADRQVLPVVREEAEEDAPWLTSTWSASATRWATCSARRATRSWPPSD